jgi:protein TonB
MRREEGRVVLKLTIDEKGTLMNVEVVESTGSDFADAAVDAAKRSRFTPARRNNAPILSVALLPIRFTLR